MLIISGNANYPLAEEIAGNLERAVTHAQIRHFDDTEIFVEIQENVRGEDAFVIQPTCAPTNDHVMELLIIIDALKRGSARRITAVIPYFGYARQDRKTGPRTPITARLVANLLEVAGAHRILTLDLHSAQIQGFFNIPTDNLFATPVFAREIKQRHPDVEQLLVVSPDVGGVLRARSLASRLGVNLAIVDKRRPRAGESEVMNIIGDPAGQTCLLIDDIADSAGTLCNAAAALKKAGAGAVEAYVSHPVLSRDASERIENSVLDCLVTTSSIPLPEQSRGSDKIRVISIAPLLAEAIRRISTSQSVSSLFA